MEKSNVISKTDYNFRKPKFSRKIRSEFYLFLLLHINRSITKKFPIEILFEMMDSDIRSIGEGEYDNQNCLKHHKTQAWLKIFEARFVIVIAIAQKSKSVYNEKVPN